MPDYDADTRRGELETYARTVYGDGDGWIEIRCCPAEEGSKRGVRSLWYESPAELVADFDAIERESEDNRHIYAGVSLRPERGKKTKGDLPVGTACHVELDMGKDGQSRGELLRRLERLPILASIVVDSGSGGIHAYWRLTEPAPREAVERVNRALADRVQAHDSIHDVTRILRPPGFLNRKPSVMEMAHVVHLTGGDVDISELEDELDPEMRAATRQERALPSGQVAPSHPSPIDHRVARARRYVAKMPEAVAGNGGHNATFAVAVAVVRGFLVPPEEARQILEEYNQRCDPPWDAKDLDHKLAQALNNSTQPWGYLLAARPELTVVGQERTEPEADGMFSGDMRVVDTLNDAGNADRWVAQHGNDMRWHLGAEVWMEWSGSHWKKGDKGHTNALRRARRTADALRSEAAAYEEAQKPDAAKALGGWWQKSLGFTRLNNMHRLARADERLAVGFEDFDHEPWLFNCANGTIDLRTGELRAHRRSDMLTQVSPAHYDPYAMSEVWDRFLATSLEAEVADYLRRVAGYTLTGLISEEKLWIYHGAGRNGKGVFQHALQQVLDTYSYTAAFSTFIRARRPTSGNNDDVADLVGRRAVWASESNQGERLNEALIKALTGGDRIFAMRKHEHSFEFTPTFKLHLSTNHRPDVHGADEGIRSRPKIVPFDRIIPKHERDPQLKAKLSTREAMSAVLAWAVQGCLEWQRYGLEEPEAVTRATQEWWDDTDILAPWIEARCVVSGSAWEKSSDLYASYKRFQEDHHEDVVKPKTFSQALHERGYSRKRKSGGNRDRGHAGLRLRGAGDV